jgi:hypothetical protein
MPESLPLTHDTIKLSHTAEGEPIEAPSAIEDTAVLNDEVMIEIAPDSGPEHVLACRQSE